LDRHLGAIAALAFFLGASLDAQAPAPSVDSLNILYLADFDLVESQAPLVVEGVTEAVEASGRHVEVFFETLDLLRLYPTDASLADFLKHLRDRYGHIHIDMILAQSSTALRIACDFRAAAAPGVPIYCFDLVDPGVVERFSKVEGVYGRPIGDALAPTIRLAHELFPKASRAYLFATFQDPGYMQGFNDYIDAVREEMKGLEFDIRINPEYSEVESALSASGEDSFALLLPGIFRLPSGEYLAGTSTVNRLTKSARVPLFGFFPDLFGTGLVGGPLFDRAFMGREAGAMILSILYGETKPIPWLYSNSFTNTLDYRALRRFSVPSRLVPPDASILFAPPPFWDAYRRPIQAFGAALILSVLALVLFVLYRWKERALLKDSNERLELTVSRRTEELRATNAELEASNANLTKSLKRIEGMQARLVADTRDSVLGRIAIGLAHQINNPLAAIRTSLYSMREVSAGGRNDVNALVRGLDSGQRALFIGLLARAKDRPVDEDGRAADSRRRALAARIAALAPEGSGGADRDVVDLLEDAGLSGLSDDELALACLPENRPVLEAAYRARAIVNGLEISLGAVDRIAETVEAVRSYARDVEPYKGGSSSVEETVERALVLLRGASSPGVRVVRALEPGLPRVAAADGGLTRIWTNLFQNAIQAMRGSGELEVCGRRDGGFVVVEVLDTGPGVPPALREKLFTPFSSTGDVDQGLGLGLSVCRRIVEGFGGSISYGEKGGRTMFTVKLPVAEGGDGR
jgi:signal transduction histidine kinase